MACSSWILNRPPHNRPLALCPAPGPGLWGRERKRKPGLAARGQDATWFDLVWGAQQGSVPSGGRVGYPAIGESACCESSPYPPPISPSAVFPAGLGHTTGPASSAYLWAKQFGENSRLVIASSLFPLADGETGLES